MKNLLILLVSLWASTAWADPAADPSGLWNTFDKEGTVQYDPKPFPAAPGDLVDGGIGAVWASRVISPRCRGPARLPR